MDSIVALINDYVAGAARSAIDAFDVQRSSGMDDAAWWAATGPWLAKVLDPQRYPLGARVGTTAGEHYQAVSDTSARVTVVTPGPTIAPAGSCTAYLFFAEVGQPEQDHDPPGLVHDGVEDESRASADRDAPLILYAVIGGGGVAGWVLQQFFDPAVDQPPRGRG